MASISAIDSLSVPENRHLEDCALTGAISAFIVMAQVYNIEPTN